MHFIDAIGQPPSLPSGSTAAPSHRCTLPCFLSEGSCTPARGCGPTDTSCPTNSLPEWQAGYAGCRTLTGTFPPFPGSFGRSRGEGKWEKRDK